MQRQRFTIMALAIAGGVFGAAASAHATVGTPDAVVVTAPDGTAAAVEQGDAPLARKRGGMSRAEVDRQALGRAAPLLTPGARASTFRAARRTVLDPRISYVSQTIDGLPVYAAQLVLQHDGDGNVTDVAGQATGVATLPDGPLSAAEAVAVDVVGAQVQRAERIAYDPAVLGESGRAVPAWDVVYSDAAGARRHELRSAVDGALLRTLDKPQGINRKICEGGPTRGFFFFYFLYKDVEPFQPCLAPRLPTGPTWYPLLARTEGQGPSQYAEVNTVYDRLAATEGYVRTMFGRVGYDGRNSPLVATADVYNTPCNVSQCSFGNGAWLPNAKEWIFGAGMAVDDVVAHEYMHAVTGATAGLVDGGQPNAINEAISDMLGETIDQGNGIGNDSAAVKWQIAEDTVVGTFRNMADPTIAYGTNGSGPDRLGSPLVAQAQNFPHRLAGIADKTFFLMSQGGTFNGRTVVGMGNDRALTIVYTALTTLMTPGTDYVQFGWALGRACENLQAQGWVTAANCAQVANATRATEIGGLRNYGTWTLANLSGDRRAELAFIQWGSSRTELHATTAESGYTAFSLHQVTPFGGNAAPYGGWQLADVGGDARPDLVHVDVTSAATAGVYATSAESGYLSLFRSASSLFQTAPNAGGGIWTMANVAGDARADLVFIRTLNKDVELYVAPSDSNFGTLAVAATTVFNDGGSGERRTGDWRMADIAGDGRADLVHVIAAGGRAWVYAASPESGYRGFSVAAQTAFSDASFGQGTFLFGDVCGDARQDLVFLKLSGTAAEVHAASAESRFATSCLDRVTAFAL